MEEFNVGVVGAGYVGLVTGACLAHVGHRVRCVDKNEARVAELAEGRVPIYEPGLEELVARGRKRLSFSTDLPGAVRDSDVLFIAVDTPPGEGGSADLSSVGAVARSVGRALAEAERERAREKPLVVVNKSTVPVGSGDYVSMLVREGAQEVDGGNVPYRVVSNPEFLREGSAVYDSLFPDRIVLGAEKRDALDTMRALYQPIVEQSFPTQLDPRPRDAVPFVTTDLASAEMIKYAANAFLATKISFINEMAALCELVGADVTNVATGIGLDDRIGARFLNAGIGWGGSCFPKDVAALRAVAREYGHEPALLDATVSVNERQRKAVIQKLQRDLRTLKGKRVALLGLAFKPNTDDLREAPSLEIARLVNSLGARVVGYDPVAGKGAAAMLPDLKVVFDPYEALAGAHAAVVVTEWEEVRSLDPEKAASLMEDPKLLVDGRNVLDPAAALDAGLLYRGFGRG
ncbi:nucleotide sugar dehydrogenase [Rubrobacter marinus]|uniref:UDP-glucose 6-dehydrogenase n=1 Tax=Rubrobacter marinus TaxID=2653852 RepID=A0A6G8Q186_9ACTN|nr:UDP-glucose/GDP-mannose dehydrogenase family protein [Rubrobacter marinus]QIN80244.1 nucleotide sugar dehydrogenase [Rubrobacter marinus]